MICKQPRKFFCNVSLVFVILALGLGCAKKKEEEEDSDPLLGVWTTACARFFADDTEIADADFCYDTDSIVGTQTEASENVEACIEKYQAYSFIDTLTFREADDAVKATTGKALTVKPEHSQLTYKRVTYSDDECEEEVATLTRTFSYQTPAKGLVTNDDVEDDPKNKFPADAVAINFQTTGAALTYHDDTYFASYQTAREVCTNDDWDEGSAFDILSVDNCLYNPFMMVDNLGADVGNGTGVDTSASSGTPVSYNAPYTTYSANWDDSDTISTSFMEGEEFYTILKLNEAKDPVQLSIGDFFDTNPFNMYEIWRYDIYPESDSELVELTSANADGDNDNHRQRKFGLTFKFDETATDKL